MGKHLLSSNQSTLQVQDNNPGCMWGMFQILDWRVKKVVPHKKRRHARYKRKTILCNQSEDQQNGVAETEPLLVKHGKSSPRKKESRTEKRINKENSEGYGTMEYSRKNRANSEYALLVEEDGKATQASLNHNPKETNKLNRDISNKLENHTDALQVFRVEKDLLLQFLRGLNVGGKKFHQASHNKARLTKSGSFPLTSSSHMRNFRSSSLKHKQNETWIFTKGEKFLAGTQAPKMSVSSFVNEEPIALVNDLGVASDMDQKPHMSSRSSQGSNHKGWNQLVLHQFKVIKQKIKHALVEFRKSGYQTSDVAIRHTASPDYNINNMQKERSEGLDDGVIQEYKGNKSSNETKASGYESNKQEVHLMRRTSSLNESLDRYTQLFEKSFSNDAKWQSTKSKSLKPATEDKINKSGHAPKFSRSNFSLPNLETIGFILQEALFDSNDLGDPMETDNHGHRKSVSLPLKIDKSLDHSKDAEIVETVEGSGRHVYHTLLSDKIMEKIDEGVTYDQKEDKHDQAVEDGGFPLEKEEISITTYLSKEAAPSLESSHEDNTTIHEEGTELETDLSYRGSLSNDSLSNKKASVTAEGTNKSLDNKNFLLFKSDADMSSNFKYVKKVLELSGFLGNEQVQMQYTVDQPIKPSLFKLLDATLGHEIESCEADSTSNPYDHHQLIFNLVNEVLIEIQERSPTYFPRPFSLNHRLHPMPKGQYLLKEVWTSVDSYLNLRPELDQTLDDVVGRDLAKNNGWMILQQEEECVALELEEMIMEDLLDELIFS